MTSTDQLKPQSFVDFAGVNAFEIAANRGHHSLSLNKNSAEYERSFVS